jgi:hypothetical protein
MMVTCHCKTLESSTNPAEKPSIGFRVKSGVKKNKSKREQTHLLSVFSRVCTHTKKGKNSLSSSSSISFSERTRERKETHTHTHTHTHTRANDTYNKRKHERKRKKNKERETSHLSRRTSELVSQQEHRLVGHLFFLSSFFFFLSRERERERERERIFSATLLCLLLRRAVKNIYKSSRVSRASSSSSSSSSSSRRVASSLFSRPPFIT